MANMETFYKGLMASESVQSFVGSTKYQQSEADATIHDGALVTLGGLAPNEVYGGAVLDDNVFLSTSPADVTKDKVVIVDIADISKGDIAGNVYKMGIKLTGLKAAPGEVVRYRKPVEGDLYWISTDCFNGVPAVGKYYTSENGATTHKVGTTEAPSTGEAFVGKIIDSRDFTIGAQLAYKDAKMWLCQVVKA